MMGRRGGRGGFTLVELVVVLTVSAVVMGMAGLSMGRYFARTAARRAAQVFAQDLAQARSFAVRSKEAVVIHFHEDTLRYEVKNRVSGTVVLERRFEGGDGIDLSGISLDLEGDSLVIDRRGFADLSGAPDELGRATFESGDTAYGVSFNGLAASRIDAP